MIITATQEDFHDRAWWEAHFNFPDKNHNFFLSISFETNFERPFRLGAFFGCPSTWWVWTALLKTFLKIWSQKMSEMQSLIWSRSCEEFINLMEEVEREEGSKSLRSSPFLFYFHLRTLSSCLFPHWRLPSAAELQWNTNRYLSHRRNSTKYGSWLCNADLAGFLKSWNPKQSFAGSFTNNIQTHV